MVRADARRLLLDWIPSNPVGRGPGWEPYPLSLRIREWIEWLIAGMTAGEEVDPRFLDSVGLQVEALRCQIEYHLQANHLLENAITLCWAGASFAGESATRWLVQGERLLRKELARQVKSDGSHEERAPMYQALLSEALLRLARVAVRSPTPRAARVGRWAQEAGERMVGALRPLVHPDGDYALLQDTALGVAPTVAQLDRAFGLRGDTPSPGPWRLPKAGYLGMVGQAGTALFFDAGAPSPPHQPGHAHAGALGVELSHAGRRIVTHTGVLTYEVGPERSYDRSTAAHSTVEIDGRDQSEMWAAFRVARRIRVESVKERADGFQARYRGPGRSGPVRHARRVTRTETGFRIQDDVLAKGRHEVASRLHFHPDCAVTGAREGFDVLVEGRRLATVRPSFPCVLTTTPYHERFGHEVERPCLVLRGPFTDRWTAAFDIRLG